jgi:hypothetical protein
MNAKKTVIRAAFIRTKGGKICQVSACNRCYIPKSLKLCQMCSMVQKKLQNFSFQEKRCAHSFRLNVSRKSAIKLSHLQPSEFSPRARILMESLRLAKQKTTSFTEKQDNPVLEQCLKNVVTVFKVWKNKVTLSLQKYPHYNLTWNGKITLTQLHLIANHTDGRSFRWPDDLVEW